MSQARLDRAARPFAPAQRREGTRLPRPPVLLRGSPAEPGRRSVRHQAGWGCAPTCNAHAQTRGLFARQSLLSLGVSLGGRRRRGRGSFSRRGRRGGGRGQCGAPLFGRAGEEQLRQGGRLCEVCWTIAR